MFYFIINVYTFVFVICLIYNYWSLFYGCVCDPLAVLLVLSVQALIKNKYKKPTALTTVNFLRSFILNHDM